MAKPIINYKGIMMDDPSDRTRRICVPQIVDRNQTKSLDDIVYDAIDRGLIAGLKPDAAQSIAAGIMTQMGAYLNAGTGVIFGDYFAVRPYLSGTIKNLLSALTPDNKLNARFLAGKAYRLNEDNFSFHNVTQSESIPKVDSVQPSVTGAESGTFDPAQSLAIVGENLKVGAEDAVRLYNCDGAEPVFVGNVDAAAITVNSDGLLNITAAGIAGIANVTKAGFVVSKTISVEGTSVVVESVMVVATKVAPAPGPVVPAPTITGAGTHGCEPGTVEAPGGVVEMTGTNLESATAIDFYVGDDGAPIGQMELWQTLEATWDAEGEVLVTDESVGESAPGSAGVLKVTTAGGSATYPVQYTVH